MGIYVGRISGVRVDRLLVLYQTSSLEANGFFALTLVEYPRNVPGDALFDKGDAIPV